MTLKNHPKKLHTSGSWEFFFSAEPTAQNSPELHFRFINSFIQPSCVGSLDRWLCDFASPRTFVKTTAPINVFCGSNIPDKNLKSIADITKILWKHNGQKKFVPIWFENFPPGMNSREKTGRIPQVHIVCLFVKFLREPNEFLKKLNERNNWQILLLIWNYFSNIYQLLKVPWSVIIWT